MADRDFERNFWRRVKQDTTVNDVMHRIPTRTHRRIVHMLDLVSDPNIAKRLRIASVGINGQILKSFVQPSPSLKELRGLARRLQTISRDIESIFGSETIPFKRAEFLELAQECRLRARDLQYIDMARQMTDVTVKLPRRMPFRAFWSHFPTAMLCHELDVPQSVSFTEVQKIVDCSYLVRGRKVRPQRSVEREYKVFVHLRSRDPLKSHLWPHIVERFLDICAAIKPATK
jgi:hypothetical protein